MLLPMLVISVSGSTSPQLPSRSCTAVSIPLRCSSVNPADTALPFLLTQPSTVRLPDRAPTRCSLTIGTLWTTEKRFGTPLVSVFEETTHLPQSYTTRGERSSSLPLIYAGVVCV